MHGMTNPTEADLVKLGYRVVLGGELAQVRDKTRISRNAQARLMGVDPESLRKWEELDRAMNIETALRIGEWYWAAKKLIEHLAVSDPNLSFDQLLPISRAAQFMGVGQIELEQLASAGKVKSEILGVLGTFIHRSEIRTSVTI